MMKYSSGRKKGFTLSEVLITLGIVGIVAAITIPTLVNKIQEYHFHAKWKENYSILNNAFKMVVAENPRMVVSAINSYEPTQEFVDAMLGHLHVVQTCGLSAKWDNKLCDNYAWYKDYQIKYKWSGIANIYSRYTTLAGGSINAYDFYDKAALLKNGASIYFGGLWSGLTIVVDVNNFNGGPNILGKDVYAISIVNNKYPVYSTAYYYNNYIEDMGFKPYGAEGTTGWNDSSQGSSGCSEHIGLETANGLSGAAGAGCSYKYLYEK